MSPTEELILRGLDILMRSAWTPNDNDKADEHFRQIEADMRLWSSEFAKATGDHP